jgi:hypothetical protein
MMKSSIADRINDRIACALAWLGPVMIAVGLAGVIISVVMYLWK